MAHTIVGNIIIYPQIFVTVDCKGSVERGVNDVTHCIRFMKNSDEMEINWVSTDFEGFSNLSELNVGESRSEGIISFGVDENDGTVLVVN